MPMTFENSPVVINGVSILASNASVSIDNPRRGIKALGIPGFAGQVSDGPVVGTISASFFATDNASDIRNLFGAGAGLAAQTFTVKVGRYECLTGIMNSMSISIEPYTPITCDVNMSFYGGYTEESAGSAPAVPDGVMHGGESTVDPTKGATDPLWGTDIVSCTYSLSQTVNPVYLLGSMGPKGYSIEDQTTEVSLAGTGLGSIVAFDELCPGETKGTITLGGICSEATESIDFTGYIINPSITVEPNKEINGSLTVFGTF